MAQLTVRRKQMPRARFYRGVPFDLNFRGPNARVQDPKLTNTTEAKAENTEDDENELEDEEKKLKSKQACEEATRHACVHEAGHVAIAHALGCDVDFVQIDKWTDRGRMVTTKHSKNLSASDYVTLLVSGGIAERMIGSKHQYCDHDDLQEARRHASDEQIERAKQRASEMLRSNWSGVLSIAEALMRWPLLRGATVRAIMEGARMAPLAHRTDEGIATQMFDVVKIDSLGRRRKVGSAALAAGRWHAYHSNGGYVGVFGDYLSAVRAL
jgi:hypothetical protein